MFFLKKNFCYKKKYENFGKKNNIKRLIDQPSSSHLGPFTRSQLYTLVSCSFLGVLHGSNPPFCNGMLDFSGRGKKIVQKK